MTITEIKRVEDCFNGSQVFEFFFEHSWQKDSIMSLASFGRLSYFGNFPKPFFRMLHRGGFHIKGVEGQNKCRIVFPSNEIDELTHELKKMFAAI